MEITLYIKDRIYLLQILPQQNNFKEYCCKRDIVNKIAFSEDERNKYEMHDDPENKRTAWNAEMDRQSPLVVEFSNDELAFLKKACEKMSEANAPDEFWATIEKIYNYASTHDAK